jgi:hypothetical protein
MKIGCASAFRRTWNKHGRFRKCLCLSKRMKTEKLKENKILSPNRVPPSEPYSHIECFCVHRGRELSTSYRADDNHSYTESWTKPGSKLNRKPTPVPLVLPWFSSVTPGNCNDNAVQYVTTESCDCQPVSIIHPQPVPFTLRRAILISCSRFLASWMYICNCLTWCNCMQSIFLLCCKITLHVSGVNYTHHQEYMEM